MRSSSRVCLVAVLFAAFLSGIHPMAIAETTQPDASASLAHDQTLFAADLYARLQGQDGNLFFSPYSISSALAMTYAGAGGKTAEQMAAVLHFSLCGDALHKAFADLAASLNNSSTPADRRLYTLVTANALWGQAKYPYRKSFLDLLANDYQAPLQEVDFQNAPEPARLEINGWVEKKTENKIQNLLGPGSIQPDTRLVLTNAIYFKSTWANPFNKHMTEQQDFHLNAQKIVPSQLMKQRQRLAYFADDDVQVVQLPYVGDQLAMILLLPRKIDGISALDQKLTGQYLDQSLAQLQPADVQLFLPRFKMEFQVELGPTLQAMGMTDAFDPSRADFSGMVEPPTSKLQPLYIGAVIHKAFITTDEEGTEAAAATAVVMRAGAVRLQQPVEPIVFRADHPFICLIRHRASGDILFMGRVSNPGV